MSVIAKLWGAKRRFHQITEVEAIQVSCLSDRKSLHFEEDSVRILLFRECEWRGRKLLFDSIAVDKAKWNNDNNDTHNIPSYCINVVQKKRNDELACEHSNVTDEDVSLLSEMIFGSVAMTYRGPSFKIHAINSAGCIMCTKIFPFSEHKICKQRNITSAKNRDTASTIESSSSNLNLQSQQSVPASTKTVRNRLSPSIREHSSYSIVKSGWDIDTSRLTNSSHSVDRNDSLVTGEGTSSFSSLRRRWLRAVSTSLVHSESDDNLGNSSDGSNAEGSDIHVQRHKTRLGLAMLLYLPSGQEEKISMRLLEHAALLEGMLDRLRHSCYECERNLVMKLYRATDCCILRLLKLLMSFESEKPTPLIWHDLLLHSSVSVDVPANTVFRSLQDMCRLLDDFDTKSTNFFLSTVVTAVLTYHLGWVYTAAPQKNRQLMQSLAQQYSCNPLWAQLNDLYGTLGTPLRIAHTVIAGNLDNVHLIESILNFLSYFIRSGLVEKCQERRCTSQTDVREAIAIYERTIRRNPSLERPFLPSSSSLPAKKNLKPSSKRSKKQLELQNLSPPKSKFHKDLEDKLHCFESVSKHEPVDFDYFEEAAMKKIKCSNSSMKNVSDAMIAIGKEQEIWAVHDAKKSAEVYQQQVYKENALLPHFQKMHGDVDTTRKDDSKLEALRRQKLSDLDQFDYNSKIFNEQPEIFPCTLENDISWQSKPLAYFKLGEEKPNLSIRERLRSTCNCQCSYTFTRVPSTSAELPEGILRKIIQRNFPESSKNMGPPAGCTSELGGCLKCRRGYSGSIQGFENSKLLLETPTNATEVLKGCASIAGTASSSSRIINSNSLEALIEANCIIELPMPRSKKFMNKMTAKRLGDSVGFSKSLLGSKAMITDDDDSSEIGYTWGMVVQGLTKPKNSRNKERKNLESHVEDEWWQPIREGLEFEAKFPLVDQPVTEALCLLGDLDNWQVGILSSTAESAPVPVGMSRLVSNMLEAFAYVWKEFRSPEKCIKLLESRLREMWLRSETLAEFLQTMDLDDVNVDSISRCLDVDAADLPLLLAVATTHSPHIAERFDLALF